MYRKIWLRFRASGILRYEPIHEVEHNLRSDVWIAIQFGNGGRAEAVALGEGPPVVHVWYCHIVKTTRNPVRLGNTHPRHIDNLRHFVRHDPGKMAEIAGVFTIG